jgi:hypothetical protein
MCARHWVGEFLVETSGMMLTRMHDTLLKALIAFVPVCLLFVWSLVSFVQGKAVGSLLQLLGAGCLVVVVLTHISEALDLWSFMHWGSPHSMGHALDLWSAVLGLTLCPLGYLCTRLRRKPTT